MKKLFKTALVYLVTILTQNSKKSYQAKLQEVSTKGSTKGSRKLFFPLKFVDLGMDRTLPKLKFVKSSNSGLKLRFPKLNFPKVIRFPKLSKVPASSSQVIFY